MNHPVIGLLLPCPRELPPGFEEFVTDSGIQGTAKVTGKRIDIFTVMSKVPGRGAFGDFLYALLREYETVAFWEFTNLDLMAYLERKWTFRPVMEYVGGSLTRGMRWDRAPSH